MGLHTDFDASVHVTATMPYACAHCGCRGNVTLTDKGVSSVRASGWSLRPEQRRALAEQARQGAEKHALKQVKQAAGLVACPQCGGRNRWAIRRFVFDAGLIVLLSFAVGFGSLYLAIGADDLGGTLGCGGLGVMAIALAIFIIHDSKKRYRNALTNARWSDLVPGFGRPIPS